MAEVLGVVASIVTIVQLSSEVVKYLKDVSKASEDIQGFIDEVQGTASILTALKSLLEQPALQSVWATSAQLITVPNGPLDQFHRVLGKLNQEPKHGTGKFKRVTNAVVWPFKKKDVLEILESI